MPQVWQNGQNLFRSPGPYPFPLDDTHPTFKRIRVELADGSSGTIIESSVTTTPVGVHGGSATVLLDDGPGDDGRGCVWVEDVNTLVLL